MIERGEEDAALFGELSVFAGDLEIRTDEAHGRDTAEADDDLRLDQLRLRAQEADTRILPRLGRTDTKRGQPARQCSLCKFEPLKRARLMLSKKRDTMDRYAVNSYRAA